MKRIGHLFEKIVDLENILEAHDMARKDKSHYEEVKRVDKNPLHYAEKIRDMLLNDSYRIREVDYSVFEKEDKGKLRIIQKLPYYPHRIIQWAIILQIKEHLLKSFISQTYSAIDGRGTLKASTDLRRDLKNERGLKYYLQLDVEKFYPNIDRSILIAFIKRKFKDNRLVNLISNIVNNAPGNKGLPIGSLLSQWLGNLYLSRFDHYVKEVLQVRCYFRYCDDLVFLSTNKSELHALLSEVKTYFGVKLKLNVKNDYAIRPISSGIDFVGFVHYSHDYVRLRRSIALNLRRKLTRILKRVRRSGYIGENDISTINSYYGWVKHCNAGGLYRNYVEPLTVYIDKYDFKRGGFQYVL